MPIISLDQNKWIELAKAWKQPGKYPQQYKLLEDIADAQKEAKVIFPLTTANIYETFKISDEKRRNDLALFQATLSQGIVFVGRHERLTQQATNYIRECYDFKPLIRIEPSFLSDVHWEAFAGLHDPRLGIKPHMAKLIERRCRQNPIGSLLEHFTGNQDSFRRKAVGDWSKGATALLSRLEKRRDKVKGEPKDMQHRIYSALLVLDDIGFLNECVNNSGVPFENIFEMGDKNVLGLVPAIPTYRIERDLVVRLESHQRRLNENDLRDMQHFSTTIPYADCLISEKFFVNIAKQSKLDAAYNTRISTNIFDIREYI
jgi:hypothetical protein